MLVQFHHCPTVLQFCLVSTIPSLLTFLQFFMSGPFHHCPQSFTSALSVQFHHCSQSFSFALSVPFRHCIHFVRCSCQDHSTTALRSADFPCITIPPLPTVLPFYPVSTNVLLPTVLQFFPVSTNPPLPTVPQFALSVPIHHCL
jgi:hypothetical protein